MSNVAEQAAPVSGSGDIWLKVIAEMEERRQTGIARYGKPVQPFNGRKALVDSYQEALDQVVYLRQRLEEEASPSCLINDGMAAYADFCRSTATYPNVGNNPVYPERGLYGELGEFFNKLKKIERDHDNEVTPERKLALEHELGDALYYFTALCWEHGTSLSRIALLNIEKLTSRMERGTLQGSGDNR